LLFNGREERRRTTTIGESAGVGEREEEGTGAESRGMLCALAKDSECPGERSKTRGRREEKGRGEEWGARRE